MPIELNHDLSVPFPRDAQARQDFISSLRSYILNDMAAMMKSDYETRIKPRITEQTGQAPRTQDAVHEAMRAQDSFRFYSAIRVNAQEMVWRSVIPSIERDLPQLEDRINVLHQKAKGSLALDPDLRVPRNVNGLDVHLMPGGYSADTNAAAGAIYDNGLAVFSAGFMGKNFDDIGLSMSNYVRHRFPDFNPKAILDCGCTIGHNTLAWARTFPKAQVTGIDVSASVLRYAHGRAESLGLAVDFRQMNATKLDFPDNSFDVVFSSMFLHELPRKDIRAYFAEAHRVLRPGGLIVTMELPPNAALDPYDQFYLDWDCYYNREPYYRAFRDQKPQDLVVAGGFDAKDFFEFTVPQYSFVPEPDFIAAVSRTGQIDGNTGRLNATMEWYGFACWKRK